MSVTYVSGRSLNSCGHLLTGRELDHFVVSHLMAVLVAARAAPELQLEMRSTELKPFARQAEARLDRYGLVERRGRARRRAQGNQHRMDGTLSGAASSGSPVRPGTRSSSASKECGVEGLTDRSRQRPYRYAHQLPFQVENYILNVKREHPSWGARKIRERLVRRFSGIRIA